MPPARKHRKKPLSFENFQDPGKRKYLGNDLQGTLAGLKHPSPFNVLYITTSVLDLARLDLEDVE